jgi:dephospho-CoA kinase
MVVVGLTGSIGMGKSTVAAQFRRCGVPVFDADRVVHGLLASKGAGVASVLAHWPAVAAPDGGIDRQALGQQVFGDPEARCVLEGVLHPLVRLERERFLRQQRRCGRHCVILDIPLLFETGGQRECDRVVVVTAPAFLQQQRVLRRRGMTPQRLRGILAAQWPDARKRQYADIIVYNGLSRAWTFRQVRRLVMAMR